MASMRPILFSPKTFVFMFILAFGFTCALAGLANETYEGLSEKNTSTIKPGQTIEFLLMSEGEPEDIMRSLPEGQQFSSYYYPNLNISFIVNNETGYICGAASGKHNGNCHPNIELAEQTLTGVYLGMPVNSVLQKLPHYTSPVESNTAPAECYYLTSNQPSTGVKIMIFDGKVIRFDVGKTSNFTTRLGAGIGTTTKAILTAYPNATKQAHPYLGNAGEYLTVKLPSGNAIIFETEFNTVSQFRLGLYPEVEFIEGCS